MSNYSDATRMHLFRKPLGFRDRAPCIPPPQGIPESERSYPIDRAFSRLLSKTRVLQWTGLRALQDVHQDTVFGTLYITHDIVSSRLSPEASHSFIDVREKKRTPQTRSARARALCSQIPMCGTCGSSSSHTTAGGHVAYSHTAPTSPSRVRREILRMTLDRAGSSTSSGPPRAHSPSSAHAVGWRIGSRWSRSGVIERSRYVMACSCQYSA